MILALSHERDLIGYGLGARFQVGHLLFIFLVVREAILAGFKAIRSGRYGMSYMNIYTWNVLIR